MQTIKRKDLFDHLSNREGSCRDINFKNPTLEGIHSFILRMTVDYTKIDLYPWDSSGNPVEGLNVNDALKTLISPGSTVQFYLAGSKNAISQLQIYIYADHDGSHFVEVTFFPQDLNFSESEIPEFLALIHSWKALMQSSMFYLRYENASWVFGNTSSDSGVIMTSDYMLEE